MATDSISRIAPYIDQLLEDESARDNLRRGADKLRAAYQRSQKRGTKSSKDKKLRRQLQGAAQSLADGASSLVHDAQKPKKRRGRSLLTLLILGVIGAGVAIALNEDLRSSLLGSSPSSEPSSEGTST